MVKKISKDKTDTQQISMNMPISMNEMLNELTAQIMIDSKIRIPKTEIYIELLDLLRDAKIKTKNITSAADITAQLVEYIKKKK